MNIPSSAPQVGSNQLRRQTSVGKGSIACSSVGTIQCDMAHLAAAVWSNKGVHPDRCAWVFRERTAIHDSVRQRGSTPPDPKRVLVS